MNKRQNAKETKLNIGLDVLAVAHQGELSAYVMQRGEQIQVLIVSQDFSGNSDAPIPLLNVSDMEDLAILTATVAQGVHDHIPLAPSLSDDLGCLAHTLEEALGVQFKLNWIPQGGVQ